MGRAAGALGRDRLIALLRDRSVLHGDFVLASGRRSSHYVDCRRTTMHAEGLALIGGLGLAAVRALLMQLGARVERQVVDAVECLRSGSMFLVDQVLRHEAVIEAFMMANDVRVALARWERERESA